MKHFTQTNFKRGWRVIGGKRYYFRSSWDANYARFLQYEKEQGRIADWFYERTTYKFKGLTRGCTQYTPDFDVIHTNITISDPMVHHEVKGYMTAQSRTKLKRMKKYHPTVHITLIDKTEYRHLTKGLDSILPGWEAA